MSTAEKIADLNWLGDIELKKKLGIGSTSIVYQGIKNGNRYAIKISKKQDDNGQILRHFRTEAAILAQINHPAILKTLEVGVTERTPYIVMEYIEINNLAELLSERSMVEDELLRFAEQIADALRHVHSRNIIHRDLKPENIFWLPDNQQLKLIDFGLAGNLMQDNADKAVGTILYMSPEQAGILKRPIDGRSDLYSVGVILVECLTGQKFLSAGVPATKLAITERIDQLLGQRRISTELTELIAKLLMQDPDDRWLDAHVFYKDVQSLIKKKSLPLRNEAVTRIDTLFIGREHELSLLCDTWQKCRSGEGRGVLIESLPGNGKTRLIEHFTQMLAEDVSFFVRGKCQEAIPLVPLKQCLRDYLENLKSLEGEQLNEITQTLRERLSTKSSVLNQICPLFFHYLGFDDSKSQQKVNQDIFIEEVAEIILTLATDDYPLILFIDDVQWIDSATMQVVMRLLAKINQSYLFLVMTARNDSENIERLQRLSQKFESHTVHRINLPPFDEKDSQKLVNNLLGRLPIDQNFMVKIFKYTNGNPFAINEYIRNIIQEGVIAPHWEKWEIDWRELERLDLPDNIVDLVQRRIEKLPKTTQDVLITASLLGVKFDAEIVTEVLDQPWDRVEAALVEGNLNFLIESCGKRQWKFVHDRIIDTLHRYCEAEKKKALYQKIALTLTSKNLTEEEYVYITAGAFAQGLVNQNPHAAYTACCKASFLADQNRDLDKAYEFLARASEIAKVYNINSDTEQEKFAEICFRCGKSVEAIDRFHCYLKTAKDALIRARIHVRLAHTYVANLEAEKAYANILKGFQEIKWSTPDKVINIIPSLINGVFGIFLAVTGWGYGKYRGTKAEKYRLLVNLHQQIGYVKFFFDLDFFTAFFGAMRIFHIAHFIGDSHEIVNIYCNLSVVFSMLKLPGISDWLYRKARTVAERLGDPQAIAHAEAYNAFGYVYRGEEVKAEHRVKEVLAEYKNVLSVDDYVFLCGVYMSSLILRGYCKEALNCAHAGLAHLEAREGRKYTEKLHYQTWCYSYGMAALIMLGRPSEAKKYSDILSEYFNEHPHDRYHWGIHLNNLVQVHFEQGEFSDVIEKDFERHQQLKLIVPLAPLHLRHFFVAKSYLRLNQFCLAGADKKRHYSKLFRRALLQLRFAADNAMLKSHYHAILASYLTIRGKYRLARKTLIRAEHFADISNNPRVYCDILITKARSHKQQGHLDTALQLAWQAHGLARHYGWQQFQIRLEKEFNLDYFHSYLSKGSLTQSTRFSTAKTLQNSDVGVIEGKHQIEINSLIEISLASSQSLDSNTLVRMALDEVINIMRADRAALFLADEFGKLAFFVGRDIDGRSFEDLEQYSSTVVDKVFSTQKPLLVSGTDEGEALGSESAVLYDLRSIMASPVSVSGKTLGVIYLDAKFARGVFGGEDLKFLQAVGTQIGIAIETARLSHLQVEKACLEKDLEVTGAVQHLLIPSSLKFDNKICKISSFYQAANQSGGDWLWYEADSNGTVTVVIGDVTGHGAGPAMITAMVSGIFHAVNSQQKNVSQTMELIHKNLSQLTRNEYLMSLMTIVIRPDNIINIFNAGMPMLALYHSKEKKVQSKKFPSNPLGIADLRIHQAELPFSLGDRFMICTDGAYEFQYQNHRMFGIPNLIKLFSSTCNQNIDQANNTISGKILQETGELLEDDIAFILVERK